MPQGSVASARRHRFPHSHHIPRVTKGPRRRDVFGCHPARPWERIDQVGLVWLIGDGKVIAISADTAVIQTSTGNHLTYDRRGQGGKP